MQDKVELLKELQDIDQNLHGIQVSRKELEKEHAELGADLDRVRTMVDGLTAEVDKLQTERSELAAGLAQEEQNVAKAESRLPSIKTQKEYVAVLKEIDTAKKLNKDLQDRIGAKDGEIEGLKRDREEKEGELSALDEKISRRLEEIAAALAEFDQAVGDKTGQRDVLLNQLPVPLRKRYQLLFERRGGVAVVEARNGNCSGCNMQLPPQLFNSLFMIQEIQSCPHCNRLLYVLPAE
ncbi:MAG: C4-type zinc ribbon domain-containing protein [Desulfuromonadaceae bacterium]